MMQQQQQQRCNGVCAARGDPATVASRGHGVRRPQGVRASPCLRRAEEKVAALATGRAPSRGGSGGRRALATARSSSGASPAGDSSSGSGGSGERQWDAVGFGQAMVDYAGYVSDDFLEDVLAELNEGGDASSSYGKGDRIQVTVDQLGSVLNKLDSTDFKVTTGGSLSNTLVALSRLGGFEGQDSAAAASSSSSKLNVCMAGLVGSDPVGSFYQAKMDRAGVSFLSPPCHATTGTVIVLTTPDAQRTMLSHFPAATGEEPESLLTPRVVHSVRASRVLLVEGYLWECGERVQEGLTRAMRFAQESGTLVCMTLSDTSVVNKHREALWACLKGSGSGLDGSVGGGVGRKEASGLVDIVFANALEAGALTGEAEPREAALALAQHTGCMACVTDGHHGSHLAGMGSSQLVPPYWMPKGPLDTCGAGDAYAAGALYGLLRGASIRGMGYAGARVSSTVISQRGARLKMEDAQKLSEVLPMLMFEKTKLVKNQRVSL